MSSLQKGVLIKDAAGNVLEKRVYAGDLSKVDAGLKAEGVIYEMYDDSDPLFMSAKLAQPIQPK